MYVTVEHSFVGIGNSLKFKLLKVFPFSIADKESCRGARLR